MSESETIFSEKAGCAPGTMIYVGENPTNHIKVTRIRFNESDYIKEEVDELK